MDVCRAHLGVGGGRARAELKKSSCHQRTCPWCCVQKGGVCHTKPQPPNRCFPRASSKQQRGPECTNKAAQKDFHVLILL